MIFGIDGNEANVSIRVGIGEYAYQMLKEFDKFHPPERRIKFQIYLKNKPLADLPLPSETWHYKVFGPKPLWTQAALPFRLFLASPKPAIFFSPSHYAPRFSPVPTAIAIMDLSYHHFPDLFRKKDLYQLEHWTKYSAKHASLIFTISKASKRDIIKLYGIPEDRVVVTYPGVKSFATLSPQVYPIHMLQAKFGINSPYFLFVGTIQPRKNIIKLIEAFAKIVKASEKPVALVIVGKKGWLYEEILKAPDEYGVSDSVKFLEFVSDEELPVLYRNAIAFVLPSLYEGFGLPVLEAMQYSCPVITSKVSSLPEAGGEAALYVDPENADDIAKKMLSLFKNEKLRKDEIKPRWRTGCGHALLLF